MPFHVPRLATSDIQITETARQQQEAVQNLRELKRHACALGVCVFAVCVCARVRLLCVVEEIIF